MINEGDSMTFCKICKKQITVDEEYGSNGAGDIFWHTECKPPFTVTHDVVNGLGGKLLGYFKDEDTANNFSAALTKALGDIK